MPENIDFHSGIRYGVIIANNVPQLVDTILINGTNVSYEEYLITVSDKIEELAQEKLDSALSSPEYITQDELFEQLEDFYPRLSSSFNLESEEPFKEVLQLIIDKEYYDAADLLIEYEVLSYYPDEDDYEYKIDDESYYMGASYIWVIHSPLVVKAKLCSPCFPNAGDLDSLSQDGYDTYGVPEKYLEQN